MNEVLQNAVRKKANQLRDVEFVKEQRRIGHNPYELRELESLWHDHSFTLADLRNEMMVAINSRSNGMIQVLLLFLVKREAIPVDFAPLLCELLEFRDPDVANEDIIEILGEVGDERAVPTLESVIWDKEFPGIDENLWAAKKAIQAISEIGGDCSRAALKVAVKHESVEIRKECEQLLRLGKH